MSTHSIPIVDLSEFTNGTGQQKYHFVAALGKAFEDVGFVFVKNDGVPQELVDNYYAAIKKFFELPKEAKRKYEIAGLAGQRGFTSFGKEQAKGFHTADLKEFWQMGQSVQDDDPVQSEYPDNILVLEIPEFNTLGRELYKGFEKCGIELLRAIAIHLGIGEFYFDKYIHNGNSILRAIYYPPITQEPKNAIRAEQHEDINLITLLVGASAEGLQILDKDDKWIDVTAPEGCLVVNVGDMLQRLTNNSLRSTTHRVVNPAPEKWHTPRFSIPFFTHPKGTMRLDCLPGCVDDRHLIKYEPITAGEYLDERLREIGLKK
jgi:isopenicillin N synthase-like dioxygenase